MGSIVSSFLSGFVKAAGDLFGAPLDFLTGKSCSSICGSTWDFICYIENFCVANLLKLIAVLVLFYIVLLFFYLLHKMGICDCLGRSLCKMTSACVASCFSACEYGSMLVWFRMKKLKRMKQEQAMEMETYSSSTSDDDFEERISYSRVPRSKEFRQLSSQRSREWRRIHLERSLRPRNHRISVAIGRGSHEKHVGTVHDIRVTRTSKFVRKNSFNRRQRRW